jgi:hypothetical protein
MKARLAILLVILLLAFLASRVRFEEPRPQQPLASPVTPPAAEPLASRPVTPQNTLFNLNGAWRGVLQPLHGSHLDPRDWNLELKFFISAGLARVYIRRGEQWQEVKPGKFRITHHKTNAIIHSIDSGGGWVESWVFSVSRHDRDSINVYGNRIINNFKQSTDTQHSRITYAATARFERVYEHHKVATEKKSQPLDDEDIAAQIQQAIERGKRLAGKVKHGKLIVLEQRVTHETNDSATLLVRYHYDGLGDDNVWISAITFNEGKSTGHWSFRPVKLQRGERAAHIRIGMSSQSPDKYCSDSFVIQAYISGGGNFFEKTIPYNRCWSKTKP